MFNRVREACPTHSDASSCECCVDIQMGLLIHKALSPDPADGQCKVIREIIALANNEDVTGSTARQLSLHFFLEYSQLHQNDSIEEWKRFEKSQQCRIMVKKYFSTSPTISDEPPKAHQGMGLPLSLARAMTSSLERLGTWANGKDGPHLPKKSSEGKTNTFSGYPSSPSKPRM